MTLLTMPAQPGQDTGLRPVPWRRMVWVTWRQHRPTIIGVLAVFAALAMFLLIAGMKIHHEYALLTACHPVYSDTCVSLNAVLDSTDWTMADAIAILLNLAPALIGAFAGAPVLARELETGTCGYAWTQSFGRERWAIAKLVLLAVVVTAVAGAFSQLYAWFFQPFIGRENLTVYSATVFDTHGVAFAAWTLAAFTIGALAGMLIRRIVPAMAVTLGVYLGLGLAAWGLRAHYPLALVASNSGFRPGPGAPWVLSNWYTGPGGRPASPSVVDQVFSQYQNSGGNLTRLLAQHDITQWTRYIPVSRFWPMQLFEAGWLLALSALAVAATVWLVRRRAA
jgi:hypothetical protein